MTGSAISELLCARHSCRAFLPEPVPRPLVDRIFSTAQRTASWCNAQPWHATVASGEALERLRTLLLRRFDEQHPATPDLAFPSAYVGRYLDRRRQCGLQLYESVGVGRHDTQAAMRQSRENFRFFGAPHVAVMTTHAQLGVYGAVDVGGFVQVLMLVMQAHGVASICQAAPAAYGNEVKGLLGIDLSRQMVCAVSFGYEAAAHPANSFRTQRACTDEAVTWIND
ncbi:nitroreductase [Hydrogenophaga sp. BPS33]|uniref:nitroreductase n=1 Tax=Hydrogenophaga sp. BPS33 TaxID=2651974 RepID=UPI00131FBD85|nr:nitroreductase [Hydrogenophaga sp. BPS33]QHE88800.1 nitroreductase [Hydrogenophaga sp. BPS33]